MHQEQKLQEHADYHYNIESLGSASAKTYMLIIQVQMY